MADDFPSPPPLDYNPPESEGPTPAQSNATSSGQQFPAPPPLDYGPEGEAEAPASAAENTKQGWLSPKNLTETATTVGRLGSLPGLARMGADYWTGKDTQSAALYHGMQDTALGNIPDTLFEMGKGALHSYLGIGDKTAEQQAQHDDQYATQLAAQHPAATWGGKILGLFGLVAGAEGATAAAATKVPQIANTVSGKIAWSSLIGAGQGAMSGFGGARDWNARVQQAKNGFLLGGLLGGVGGAVGAGVEGKLAGSAHEAAEKAELQKGASQFGLSTETALKEQAPEYTKAMSQSIPNSDMSMGDVSHSIQGKALDLLRQAGTKEAALSSDGVRSIAIDLAATLKAQNIDMGRHIEFMSPSAQKAWGAVEDLAKKATYSPDGEVSLADVATYGKLINSFYKDGDQYYQAIRSNYNKFMDNALNSTMFKGDQTAIQDYQAFKKIYGMGAQLNSKTALGKILDYRHTANEVTNWVTGAAKVGEMHQATDLLDSIKGLVGEASPEWEALRSLTWKSTAGAGINNPKALALSINNLTQAPFAKSLYSPEQLQNMQQLASIVGKLTGPEKENAVAKLLHGMSGHGHATGFTAGALLGAGHAAYHGFSSGEDPPEIMWNVIKQGAIGGGMGALAPHMARALPAVPSVAKYAVPFAATQALNPMQGKSSGGKISQHAPNQNDQHNERKFVNDTSNKHPHWSSSSLTRAMSIARRAKSQ